MNHSRWRSHLTALLTALIACVGLLSLSSAPAWAKAGTITEFPTPTGSSDPIGITTGPDGNLWFTAGTDIGRITTAGSFTGFPVPQALGEPQFITAGPDGNLWFTYEDSTTNVSAIGRITTSGKITLTSTPTASSLPTDITAGPDGAMWFTEGAGKVGRITTS